MLSHLTLMERKCHRLRVLASHLGSPPPSSRPMSASCSDYGDSWKGCEVSRDILIFQYAPFSTVVYNIYSGGNLHCPRRLASTLFRTLRFCVMNLVPPHTFFLTAYIVVISVFKGVEGSSHVCHAARSNGGSTAISTVREGLHQHCSEIWILYYGIAAVQHNYPRVSCAPQRASHLWRSVGSGAEAVAARRAGRRHQRLFRSGHTKG